MAGNGDLKTHEATYGSMIGMLKWGSLACAVLVAIIIYLIA